MKELIKLNFIFICAVFTLGGAPELTRADSYLSVGFNQGLYANSEDGRAWGQAALGAQLSNGMGFEAGIVYLGNDSHYESSRSRTLAVSILPARGPYFARIGALGFKNVWHTYATGGGPDFYREENRSGLGGMLGIGWQSRGISFEVIRYTDAGRLAGSDRTAFTTFNINYRLALAGGY